MLAIGMCFCSSFFSHQSGSGFDLPDVTDVPSLSCNHPVFC